MKGVLVKLIIALLLATHISISKVHNNLCIIYLYSVITRNLEKVAHPLPSFVTVDLEVVVHLNFIV